MPGPLQAVLGRTQSGPDVEADLTLHVSHVTDPPYQLPLGLSEFLNGDVFLLLKSKQTKLLDCIGVAFPRTQVIREK